MEIIVRIDANYVRAVELFVPLHEVKSSDQMLEGLLKGRHMYTDLFLFIANINFYSLLSKLP